MALKNYYKLPAVLLWLPLLAQNNAILTITPPHKLVAKRNTSVSTKLAVSLSEGYHANSNTPSEAYLIPLRLTWTSDPLQVESITFPKPHDEKYSFSPTPLSVFTGAFDITTKFKVPSGATPGLAVLLGKLRYQACNDTMCFPPKTVEVKLPVEVQ